MSILPSVSLTPVAVLLVAFALPAIATPAADGTALGVLFDASGVPAQLGSVGAVVADEASAARVLCEGAASGSPGSPGSNGPSGVEAVLERALAPAALEANALDALRERLGAADIAAAARWYRSVPGRRIVAAERASAAFDEAFVTDAVRALSADPAWDAIRREHLRDVLVATRVGAFVTVLNEGMSALVELAGRCTDAPPVAKPIANEADLSFYGFFVGIELIGPTGVVLRDIDEATLDAQLAFARSPSGARWYRALVESTAVTLERAREALVEAPRILPAGAGSAAR